MPVDRIGQSLPALLANVRRRTDRRLKRCLQSLAAERPRAVLFVAGCQRSGTNMVMDLLDASRETDVYHEHDPRAFVRYELRETEVIAALHARSRAPVMVVKTLCDLERLPALCARFRAARVLWIYRDYRDVVNSMLVSFRNQAQQIRRLASGEDTSWWGRGLSTATLAVLREHVTPDIDDASAAALQWFVRAGMYFELEHHRAPTAMLVKYEALVNDPVHGAARIYDFAGVLRRGGFADGIHRQSVGKRRPPLLAPHVAALCESLTRALDEACAGQRPATALVPAPSPAMTAFSSAPRDELRAAHPYELPIHAPLDP
ncbi:MAG: sulfotransferase [Gammaproteobacteria bacterium]